MKIARRPFRVEIPSVAMGDIAFNLLIFFVIATTFYFHDFWNQTGAEAKGNMIQALKNLSIIGGLFIIAGNGRSVRAPEPVYTEPASHTY